MAVSKAKSIAETKPRERRLIILPDQGAPVKVSTSLFGIKSRDNSWNSFLDSFMRANGEYLKALDIELSFSAGPDAVELGLKANGIVGAVPLRAPDTHKTIGGIIVRPRYGWGAVGFLFSAIGWSATPELLKYPLVPGSAQEVPPWIIAGPVVAHLERLLKYSAPRFREIEEVRSTPRGRIDWPKYCSNQLAQGKSHYLPCQFSDLEEDRQLRRYIRWTLERVSSELSTFIHTDAPARNLWERVQAILAQLGTIRPALPNHQILDQLERQMQRQSRNDELSFTAIRWVLDERGLAGSTDLDGLSWRITMHDLFEKWVETLVRQWAKDFGGRVTCGRKFDSQSPIRWERPAVDSLSSLIPDVVVETPDETFIFDAKYKGFLEETDDLRWRETKDLFRDEHRHDLHQVLAYASMYQTKKITVALVYPVKWGTWVQIAARGRDIALGVLDGPGRQIRLALIAVPVEAQKNIVEVVKNWNGLLGRD